MKKRFKTIAFVCLATMAVVSCDENNDNPIPSGETFDLGDGSNAYEISSNMTLTYPNTYNLKGFVYVTEGATLTIEPGVVIKGEKESKATLIVERGGKLIAEGTSERPIVFTSAQAPGKRKPGDWGGIILLGKAKNNMGEQTIEGGVRSKHGGNDDTDNSGVLKYVRCEFAGIEYSTDNEINAITFGSVGSGTTVDYVQVSYSGDDSYEWFGGSVNCKHLVALGTWDDDFDTDNGFSGKLQFLAALRNPKIGDKSASNGFESDNDASGSSNTPLTKPVFSNVTLIGPFYGKVSDMTQAEVEAKTADAANGAKGGKFQAAMHLRRNSSLNVYNSVFTGWPYGLRATDKKGTANDGIAVKNVIFAGMWKNFYDDEKVSENFFNRAGNNTTLATTNEIISKDGDYSSVVASAVQGAEFVDEVLNNSFFEKVTYKGAFDGTNDWTAGWTNWDPQNTEY